MKIKPPSDEVTLKMAAWEVEEITDDIARMIKFWESTPAPGRPAYPLALYDFAKELKEALP